MVKLQKSVYFVINLGGKLLQQQKRGHLSNKQLAKDSSTTLCPRVPKQVSDFFIDQLSKSKQRKAWR